MHRSTPTVALLFSTALIAAASPALASDDLAALLPATTVSFLSNPDIGATRAQMDATQLGALQKAPTTEGFFKQVNGYFFDSLGDPVHSTDAELRGLIDASAGFAFADVLAAEQPKARVLLFRQADDAEHSTLRDQFQASVGGRAQGRAGETVEGVQLTTFRFEDAPPTVVFFHDGLLGITNDVDVAREVVKLATGHGGGATLAADPAYRHVMERAARYGDADVPAALSWFYSPTHAVTATEGGSAEPGRGYRVNQWKVFSDQGLSTVHGIGGAARFGVGGDEARWQLVFFAPEPPRGLSATFGFPQADKLAPPAWVPANVDQYFAFNFDFKKLKVHLGPLLDAIYGAGLTQFYDQLKKMLREDPTFGLDLDKDVLDPLGKRVYYVSRLRPSPDQNGEATCTVFEIGDNKALANSLERLFSKESEARKTSAGGIDVWVFDLPQFQQGRQGQSGDEIGHATPTAVAVVDGHVFVASDQAFLEEILAGRSGDGGLASAPAYQKMAGSLPGQLSGAPSVIRSFIRPESLLRAEYELLESGVPRHTLFGQLVDSTDAFDLAQLKLPAFDQFQRAQSSVYLDIVPDKGGWYGVARITANGAKAGE